MRGAGAGGGLRAGFAGVRGIRGLGSGRAGGAGNHDFRGADVGDGGDPGVRGGIVGDRLADRGSGRAGGGVGDGGRERSWTAFVEPWASPIMWLFLGGFVLAHTSSKTELDKWLAGMVLGRFATSPAKLLASVMGITFFFSMFMSNTATAAMMIAVTAPILRDLPKGSRIGKGLVLGVAAGANLGGIGTIIGTPPNAIAAGQLGGKIDFFQWMLIAVPPALVLAGLVYGLIWRLYLRGEGGAVLALDARIGRSPRQQRERMIVMVVFSLTVLLWITGSFTGLSSPVVSFIPIVGFAVFGIITAEDMRRLPWDVLLLLAGGLSLGVGVEVTGLADWIAGRVPAGAGADGCGVCLRRAGAGALQSDEQHGGGGAAGSACGEPGSAWRGDARTSHALSAATCDHHA